ncbi:2-polyprenyl-3-methyl-5-hydroxy-6-metoxy-1,4-benzoquinol methylase [Chitinophaga sp. CF118]|uniref:methyltransferase domain-containing protein n=1 Tax=Chitinophaga sp. CF118 TaxID=1884367 RepID=UPI0008E10083|nr:methyltransferase domain-containing protein [Chitinophaga sp. CF118]SFD75972.1 2-polyprenyl-3-methyl-5-hydroxy-6-metoxy-1,4-benzoquinol methylase [Chitinophaga sp. CF118]
MFINTRERTLAPEIMDDFLLEGEELRENLDEIAQINRLLGGNKATLSGVAVLLNKVPAGKEIVIADIGCGNGDMLRELAVYGRKHGLQLKLRGIDANNFAVRHATVLSANYPEISYECIDVMDEAFDRMPYDILLCTLTLHHFKTGEILQLMNRFLSNATVGIVINDLHRSALAYRLFHLISVVFRLGKISREDGLTSILRGFKRKEILELSESLNIVHYTLRWKWAFRYQWIISNL